MPRIDERFPSRLASIDEAPEPLRAAMAARLPPDAALDAILFAPLAPPLADAATLLAVLPRCWLMASYDGRGAVDIHASDYAGTLAVELTVLLLQGRLTLHFAENRAAGSASAYFNTVENKIYREALELIINRTAHGFAPAAQPPDQEAITAGWPIKLHNLMPLYLPHGRNMLAGCWWPAVHGGFGRELSPAAALALTESEVALLADEKAWTRGSNHGKLGFTVSYLPRSRLQSWQTHVEGRMGILELTLGAAAGNEAFHVALPPEHIPKVREVLASVHWPRPGDSLDVRPPG